MRFSNHETKRSDCLMRMSTLWDRDLNRETAGMIASQAWALASCGASALV